MTCESPLSLSLFGKPKAYPDNSLQLPAINKPLVFHPSTSGALKYTSVFFQYLQSYVHIPCDVGRKLAMIYVATLAAQAHHDGIQCGDGDDILPQHTAHVKDNASRDNP